MRDGLITPAFSLVGYSSVTLSFKYAYIRYDAANADSFAVYISTNCGTSWSRLVSYRETQSSAPFAYVTAADDVDPFTPAVAADWCGNTGYGACKVISLSAYTGSTIKLKFENISGFGNNFYIDDISLTGVASSPAPVADFSASSTSACSGNSIVFTDLSTNTPTNWSWTFTPNTVTYVNGTNSFSKNPEVTFGAGGNYTVALNASNPGGGNTKTKTNYITASTSVVPSISISVNDSDICEGQSANFTSSISNGGSAPVYQWRVNNTNTGNNSAAFSSTGLSNGDVVSCVLTSNAVCATPPKDTSQYINMTVNPKPAVSLSLGTKSSCLIDTTISLTGGSPAGGIYSGQGVSSGQFKPLVAGAGAISIAYTITDVKGCANNAIDIITVNTIPAVPTISNNNNTLTCSLSGLSYKWFYNGTLITGASNQTYTATQSGNYSVTVTNSSGCSNSSIVYNIIKSGMVELFSFEGLRIYPNPSNGVFNLEFSMTRNARLEFTIYDATGKLVVNTREDFKVGINTKNLNLKEYANGIYLLKIQDEFSTLSKSLIIE